MSLASGMGMMGMPCMGYGYDMSGMGMACQPMMMGMQQQTKDAQEAGLSGECCRGNMPQQTRA